MNLFAMAILGKAFRAAGMIAFDGAAYIAAIAAFLSTALAATATYSTWKIRHGKRGVDAIRVTQETMLSTIDDLRTENRELRARLDLAEERLRECRRALGMNGGRHR